MTIPKEVAAQITTQLAADDEYRKNMQRLLYPSIRRVGEPIIQAKPLHPLDPSEPTAPLPKPNVVVTHVVHNHPARGTAQVIWDDPHTATIKAWLDPHQSVVSVRRDAWKSLCDDRSNSQQTAHAILMITGNTNQQDCCSSFIPPDTSRSEECYDDTGDEDYPYANRVDVALCAHQSRDLSGGAEVPMYPTCNRPSHQGCKYYAIVPWTAVASHGDILLQRGLIGHKIQAYRLIDSKREVLAGPVPHLQDDVAIKALFIPYLVENHLDPAKITLTPTRTPSSEALVT